MVAKVLSNPELKYTVTCTDKSYQALLECAEEDFNNGHPYYGIICPSVDR